MACTCGQTFRYFFDQSCPSLFWATCPVLAGVALAALLIMGHRHLGWNRPGISTILTRTSISSISGPGWKTVDAPDAAADHPVGLPAQCVPVITTSAGTLIMAGIHCPCFYRAVPVLYPCWPRCSCPAGNACGRNPVRPSGALAVVAWYVLFPDGLSPVYPGFLVSLLTIILVSLVDRRSPGARSRLTDTTK